MPGSAFIPAPDRCVVEGCGYSDPKHTHDPEAHRVYDERSDRARKQLAELQGRVEAVTDTVSAGDVDDIGLLTPNEHECVDLLGRAATLYAEGIVSDRSHPDVGEFIAHVHDLQNTVLAQAAARAYPHRYRLAGKSLR